MSEKANIHGIPVTVVSDEEAEKSDYVVCMPWGTPNPFDDNLKGICCKCGCDVMYHWHMPRKPKRLCMQCFMAIETK